MKITPHIFCWIPRIIAILAILFVSLFAADAFNGHLPFREQLTDFIIHLVPSFVLLAMLVISWKWELAGGILFTVTGLALAPIIFLHNYRINHFEVIQCIGIVMLIAFPFIAAGLLFIASHFFYNKKMESTG